MKFDLQLGLNNKFPNLSKMDKGNTKLSRVHLNTQIISLDSIERSYLEALEKNPEIKNLEKDEIKPRFE